MPPVRTDFRLTIGGRSVRLRGTLDEIAAAGAELTTLASATRMDLEHGQRADAAGVVRQFAPHLGEFEEATDAAG